MEAQTAVLIEPGYTQYQGKLRKGRRWLPIFLFGLECTMKSRMTIAVLALAWIHVILRVVLFLLLTQGHLDPKFVDAQGPRYFSATLLALIRDQIPFLVLLLSIVGSGLIANDKSKRAYQVYFAHPLTPSEYLAGKTLVAFFYCFLTLWLPILLFWGYCFILTSGYADSPTWDLVEPDITMARLLQTILYLSITTVSITALLLMLSISFDSAKLAALTFVGIIIVGLIIKMFLAFFYHMQILACLSYTKNLELISERLFQMPDAAKSNWQVSLVAILILFAICAIILGKKLRKLVVYGK